MDLNLIKETILRWVKSCETSEQVELCAEAMQVFIVIRFAGIASKDDIDIACYELIEAMIQKRAEIIQAIVWHKEVPEDPAFYFTL